MSFFSHLTTSKKEEKTAASSAVKKDAPFSSSELSKAGREVSIIKLVDSLVQQGFRSKASDIHIDPETQGVRVRMRIDGILHDVFLFAKELQSEIITRLKVLSGLRTDEHQAAQDGRFKLTAGEVPIDVRVSIAPTYYGENAVLRILASQSENFTLEALGFSKENQEKLLRAMKKPFGMILATGPTGSGKTSTLYTVIRMLNTPEVSIITIEDPIEYSIDGIEQIQVNARTGVTFADGLRSVLRQDPNVIMVGEIRDQETAAISVNAALTGHLLLSTLHTNDAVTTLPRLMDMKIEPFLIASTVNVALGQRLLRRVCESCKQKYTVTEAELKSILDVLPAKLVGSHREFYKGKGCAKCDHGYKGRTGIHEVLEINEEIRDAIMRRADASDIQKLAIKNGMKTMLEDGFAKAVQGITTIEEVLRVINE